MGQRSLCVECGAGVRQVCRMGMGARLTCKSRGTHLPPRAPLLPVAGRWQLPCGQHPGCWRQQVPWQLKAQRVGLEQRSRSLRAHSPALCPGKSSQQLLLFPLLVPDLSLFQSTLLGEPNGLGSMRTSGRDYFPGPRAWGLTIQAAATVEPIQRGWNKRGGPRAVIESNRPNH